MTLHIFVRADGQLDCLVPEHDYSYTVASWETFFAATGTMYLDDYIVYVHDRRSWFTSK